MIWRCQEDSLAGFAGRTVRVTALRCRRWSCPHCAKRLRRRMVARALAGFESGERVRMLTLTSPGDEDFTRSYAELRPRWKRFRELLRRRFRRSGFEYFAVIERQQRGHAHLHVLFRGPFIPASWLTYAARKAGFGKIADVRAVGKQAGAYVAKYLGKEMGRTPEGLGFPPLPKWHRRASWSRGWALHFAQRGATWRASLAGYTWYLANGSPLFVAHRLARLGYELEAIDYGDVPPDGQRWEVGRQERFVIQRPNDRHPVNCWLCAAGGPLARRAHGPRPRPVPAAPAARSELTRFDRLAGFEELTLDLRLDEAGAIAGSGPPAGSGAVRPGSDAPLSVDRASALPVPARSGRDRTPSPPLKVRGG
ncbi:MAG: hypothetical protein WEB29_02265 [Chloroflexota bacterium]